MANDSNEYTHARLFNLVELQIAKKILKYFKLQMWLRLNQAIA